MKNNSRKRSRERHLFAKCRHIIRYFMNTGYCIVQGKSEVIYRHECQPGDYRHWPNAVIHRLKKSPHKIYIYFFFWSSESWQHFSARFPHVAALFSSRLKFVDDLNLWMTWVSLPCSSSPKSLFADSGACDTWGHYSRTWLGRPPKWP